MKRSSSLKRTRANLKPSRPKKPRMSEKTMLAAARRSKGHCACGCDSDPNSWHHIFPRSKWPELIDEPDNVVFIAALCHMRHEAASRRM